MPSGHSCEARKSGFGNGQGTFFGKRGHRNLESLCKIHQNAKPKTPKRPNQNPRKPKAKCGKTRFQILEKRVEKTRPEQKKKPMGTQSKKCQGRHAMLQSTSSRPTDCQSALSGFLRLGWHWIVVLNDILKKPIFTTQFLSKLQPRKVTKKGHFFLNYEKKKARPHFGQAIGPPKIIELRSKPGVRLRIWRGIVSAYFQNDPPKKIFSANLVKMEVIA